MDTQTKQAYADLINLINIDPDMKTPIVDFILSYEGKNAEEYKLLIVSLVFILNKFSELEIKAAAFDAISESNEDYKAELAALKEEYNDFVNNKTIPSRPKINADKNSD
ncbi:hypothetical protein GYA27_03945 [candidate division WWE3 bacterium]|uniref:Uncharacterized protein n=1 Tax=candidate division WWE3 bacterium TaxID=2053526 RepID=A0A7X9DKU0_UNCKA|nr:hypothetical protein [candidate division WWE3 bacterium]